MDKLGKFFVVGTPIGNMGDITLRAKETLVEASYVFCEDTRVTRNLLTSIGSHAQVKSFHSHSSVSSYLEVIVALKSGYDVCYVTDAGTPGISDPGNELVAYLVDSLPGVSIIPIPGVSALTSLASVSGMNLKEFIFTGFAPKKKTLKFFTNLISQERPFIYYDSPYRILKNLETIISLDGGKRTCVVGRELTKVHETIYRGSVTDVFNSLKESNSIKGEVVVIVGTSRINTSELG